MTSTSGAQSAVTCNVGIAVETTSGTAATAPTDYIVLGGDISPVTEKKIITKDIAGSMFPSLGYKGVETHKMPFPMLPVIEDATSPVRRNGLGTLLLCLFGADTPDQMASTVAYNHDYSWETLIKTFTKWCHYDTNDNDKTRMCAVDSLAMKIAADGELALDFDTMGADTWTVLDTDYGSAAYCDMATAKQLTGLGARLEFGQPGATVREAFEELTLNFKRNLDFGAPGKAGQHPAGSGSPRIVTSARSNVELGINLRDLDREEVLRSFAGGNTDPTATRQSDLYNLVKARVTIYGPAICSGINGEADYVNAGTTAATFAGSYSGSSTVEVGEIEMSDSNIYETALGSNKDLSFKLLDTDATYEVATGSGLAVTVTGKDILVTLGGSGSTAAAILAALLAEGDVTPLLTPSLANGSDGTGTVTLAQSKITSTSFKDGFRYRYTTGAGWSTWTAWIEVTKSAQDLHAGITVTFDDDDITAAADRFYYCSHYRYMLRATLPDMNYQDAVNVNFSGGVRKADIQLFHPNTANKPTLTLRDTRSTAYA